MVLMIVGGAQTRIGSHRMYVQLARFLCGYGLGVLRFDYEGLGDSHGDFIGYEYAGPSIRTAIDAIYAELPGVKSLVIWSLCDGAAASIIYAPTDERITAMVLANPFLETEAGKAQTMIKYYYSKRLLDREFWKKMIRMQLRPSKSLRSFFALLKASSQEEKGGWLNTGKSMPDCILESLNACRMPVHLLIGSEDIQGLEFYRLIRNDDSSKKRLIRKEVVIHFIKDGDHTFTDPVVKKNAFAVSLAAIQEYVPQTIAGY